MGKLYTITDNGKVSSFFKPYRKLAIAVIESVFRDLEECKRCRKKPRTSSAKCIEAEKAILFAIKGGDYRRLRKFWCTVAGVNPHKFSLKVYLKAKEIDCSMLKHITKIADTIYGRQNEIRKTYRSNS